MKPLRDKIAEIIDRETNARLMQDEIDILNGHEVAQSIIAALPDMVAPLVWDRGVVDWACLKQGGKYVACSTTPYGSWAWWLDGDDETREVCPSEEAAKAAANAHNAAAVVAAITGVKP